MAFMDRSALELRRAAFSHGGRVQQEVFDAYLRSIGVVLPSIPPVEFAPVHHAAHAKIDYSVKPPALSELYAAATDARRAPRDVKAPVLPDPKIGHPKIGHPKNSKTRPRLCPDYEDDIDANLKMMEKNAGERPSPDYLTTVQGDKISPLTRGALVLWMDKFVRHYELAPGTLHLAVACIDRVLSVRTVRSYGAYELQLLGATAVFTAAKYEDQSTKHKLNTAEIARYCGLETSEEVRETEREMMKALGFQISGPTARTFVGHFTRYFSQGKEELRVQRLAHRIADQSLLCHVCVGFLPSVVAASAIFLARFALNPSDVLAWNSEMQELTGYGSLDLSSCVQIMYSFSQSLICNPPF